MIRNQAFVSFEKENRMRKFWTDKEIRWIKNNLELSNQQIADKFEVNLGSVRALLTDRKITRKTQYLGNVDSAEIVG